MTSDDMHHVLPRFTQTTITTDPLEIAIAQRAAREDAARQAIAKGAPPADPADLRGIPCIAQGVGGTSPGTNPYTELRDKPSRTPSARSATTAMRVS